MLSLSLLVLMLVGRWNSWNSFGCGRISDPVMRLMADSFVKYSLDKAGYQFVNMDDCWMEVARADQGTGPQIPNASKFPFGLAPLVDYVHSKGLKFGLYTSRSPLTCQKFAASCEHETVDAKQYADWQVDYLKDDSCGDCRDTLVDYQIMQSALDATGRRFVLSIEGQPDVTVVSKGGHGNLRRIGHDIRPNWNSMTSLVDIGSGLYPYAHNDSGTGGFWNDLDMLEVGRIDFNADAGQAFLQHARAHFGMWCIMKAPLILGNDLSQMGPLTLATITNKNALAINQDPLGVQGRRYLSVPAPDQSIQPPLTGQVILAKCSGSAQQQWRLRPSPTGHSYQLSSTDSLGKEWCLNSTVLSPGGFSVAACPQAGYDVTLNGSTSVPGVQPFEFAYNANGIGWDNTFGASGPVPHSRYLLKASAYWMLDYHKAVSGPGSTLSPKAGQTIIDDNNIGNVSSLPSEDFCLELSPASNLEVWAGPLTGGRWAVALFNRSPSAAPITARWALFTTTPAFALFDVWGNQALGTFRGSFTGTTPAYGVMLLIATPAA